MIPDVLLVWMHVWAFGLELDPTGAGLGDLHRGMLWAGREGSSSCWEDPRAFLGKDHYTCAYTTGRLQRRPQRHCRHGPDGDSCDCNPSTPVASVIPQKGPPAHEPPAELRNLHSWRNGTEPTVGSAVPQRDISHTQKNVHPSTAETASPIMRVLKGLKSREGGSNLFFKVLKY